MNNRYNMKAITIAKTVMAARLGGAALGSRIGAVSLFGDAAGLMASLHFD